ncbi:C-C motif chemokine 3-like [Electrophorus electricus]|uniref:Chemokine (C-C motif) ligand 19b n=1 Tax=Electrophorus electricus TaxID=8005 RepID=A0A4W4G9H4_ELEEL|nr:C-C motif chemokine 3-like [Electrophorus electricus]
MMSKSVTVLAATFLMMLLVFSWNCAEATDTAADCCLTTKNKSIPPSLVKSYYVQTEALGCREHATVFITKKGKKLCAPPPTKKWVRKLISQLERKSKPKSKRQQAV